MVPTKRLIAIPAMALALYASACKESTSPSSVDPAAMATTVNNFSSVFTGNAAFQSLSALSENFTLGAPAALPIAPVLPAPGASWQEAAASARSLMTQLSARAPAAVLALFPANVLGKTFQWDTLASAYRITDSSLAGASANGVRFFLYVVLPGTHVPVLPLQKIGYVDLIDQSTAQANILRIVLQFGAQTIADYTITGVKTTTDLTLTANGYVTDGVTQTTFTLQHVLTLADSSLLVDYDASGGGASVAMHTTISGAGGNTLTLDWTVEKNGSVAVIGTITPIAINVQFQFNGTTWATVSGDPNAPIFAGANGRQLTTTELVAMGQILEGFGAIADSLNGVFGPAFLVF